METNNFQSGISVKISAAEVIQKISNVPGWWGVTFSGSSGKQNDACRIEMGGDSFFDMTVTELIPGKKVVWLITDCHMPWYLNKKEWADNRLIFELSENKDTTDLSFIHEGLTPAAECYADCAPGWTHWIQTSLFSYMTTGQGVFRAPTK